MRPEAQPGFCSKRERGLEPKVNVFCTIILKYRSRAEQTVATQACYRGGSAAG